MQVVAIVCAILVSAGLYYAFGRNDPIPSWIIIPPEASVRASHFRPSSDTPAFFRQGPQYFLQLHMPGDPQSALAMFVSCVSGFVWDQPTPRAVLPDDLAPRRAAPKWFREHLLPVEDKSGGRFIASTTSTTRIYLYAWPTPEGCVIELIQEGEL